jgi:hypothetical protein
MKRCLWSFAAILGIVTLGLMTTANAGPGRPYSFFASGEFNFAVSPEEFTDYYISGFGVGLGIEYPVGPRWALIGLLNIKFFSPAGGMIKDWWTDPGEYPNSTNIEVSEGGVTAGSFAILGKGSLKTEGSRLFPYIKGGFGLTIAGADEIKVTFNNTGQTERQTVWASGVEKSTNLSIIVGLGLEKLLGRGNSSLFLDASLHMIKQENVNPTMAGITLGYKF